MQSSKFFLAIASIGLSLPALSSQAQYYPAPQVRPAVFYLGKAHVDGQNDHDDIHVGRYEGRSHSVMLKVHNAPILFDRVVIRYGDGYAQTLPVNRFIPPGASSQWIVLPGGERVIHSVELWYSRARPEDPNRPEVELYGAP
jgi:hypothetical protein